MSLAKVAWGWGVQMASEYQLPMGNLIVVGGGYWSVDNSTGYSGFNGKPGTGGGDESFKADSTRTLLAMIRWLTGKSSDASILIAAQPPPSSLFEAQFQTALTDAGHEVTLTGEFAFTGFDPLAYDCLIAPQGVVSDDPPYATHNFIWCMDYILSHGGKILAECSTDVSPWSVYGFAAGNPGYGHSSVNEPPIAIHFGSGAGGYGPPNWRLQRPFACNEEFGNPGIGGSWGTDLYALVMYSGTWGLRYASPPANERGGTSIVIPCQLDAYSYHGGYVNELFYDSLGVIGLWKP